MVLYFVPNLTKNVSTGSFSIRKFLVIHRSNGVLKSSINSPIVRPKSIRQQQWHLSICVCNQSHNYARKQINRIWLLSPWSPSRTPLYNQFRANLSNPEAINQQFHHWALLADTSQQRCRDCNLPLFQNEAAAAKLQMQMCIPAATTAIYWPLRKCHSRAIDFLVISPFATNLTISAIAQHRQQIEVLLTEFNFSFGLWSEW